MKYLLLFLMLASLACITTTEPFVTYPVEDPAKGGTDPTPAEPASLQTEEPYSGAVFEPETSNIELETKCAGVTASQSLHLRAEPSEKSAVLAYLYHGDQVQIVGRAKPPKWWNVQHGEITGWAKAEFLQEEPCQ